MNTLKHYLMSENANGLYKREAVSSIGLTKDVADKINEIIDYVNAMNLEHLAKEQEQDGRISKGVLFMKDNLLNSLRDLFELYEKSGKFTEIYGGELAELSKHISNFDVIKTPQMYGAKGDGVHDDTKAMQEAINNSLYVYIPKGVYCVKSLQLKSNTYIAGNNATFKCLNNTEVTGNHATVTAHYINNLLENVTIDGVVFEGNKENISNPYFDVIGIFALEGETVRNISIKNCLFKNFKEDAIRFMYSKDSHIENITIENCVFNGVTNKNPSLNAIRFVISDYFGTYGYYPVKRVFINNCKAEMCRTLADIKRGCENVSLSNLFSHNMNDCHNSIDGCRNVTVENMFCSMDSDFNPTTGTNFLEIQGEHIHVKNMIADGQSVTRDGLQVTDYGHPDENGVGYISKNISISDCLIRNVNRNGYNVMNGDNVKIYNCYVENAGAHSFVFASGDGRNDNANNKLTGKMCHCVDCVENNCVYGLSAKNMNDNNKILNVDNVRNENGFLRLFNAESMMLLPYFNLNVHNPLNENHHLINNGTSIDFYNLSNVVFANSDDKPTNCYNAILLSDENVDKLGELQCATFFEAKKGDIITFSIKIKKNTSNYCSVLIKEYNNGTWLTNTFISSPYLTENGWNEYIGQCTIKNEETNAFQICIVPASSYNNPASTGSTKISDFKVYKM